MKTGKLKVLWFAVLLVSTTSCFKEYFEMDKLSTNIQWEPNVCAAAINTSLTIRDVLRDYDTTHLFSEDQTGFLYLMYSKRIFSLPAKDIVTLPDIPLASQYTSAEFAAQGFPIPNNTATITHNLSAVFAMVHAEVFDSIKIKDCEFIINFNTTFQHDGILTISLPNATLFGSTYSRNIPVAAGQTIAETYFDLAGYVFDLTSGSNDFPVLATYTLTSSGNPILPADVANLSINFHNIQYDYLYGNMGNYSIVLNPDTVHIDIFDNALNGDIFFVDPKIRLKMTNSFGVSMAIGFSNFLIYSTLLQGYNTYQFPIGYNPHIIPASAYPSPYSVSAIQFDTASFPQIRTIVSESPKYIFFSAVGATIPPLPGQQQFISDSSRFSVDLEVELPFWGRATLFAMQDTLDFNVADAIKDSGDFTMDNIEYVMFKLNVENGMPMDVIFQLYFTDTLFNVYDSLFYTPTESQIIQSGVLNSAGRIVAPFTKISEIKFENARLQKLRPVQKVLIRGTVKTTNNATENVRFYSDYAIRVKFGMQVQASVNSQQFE